MSHESQSYKLDENLAIIIGYNQAKLLTYLLNKRKIYTENKTLQSDGSFFGINSWIRRDMNVTYTVLSRIVKKLTALNLIRVWAQVPETAYYNRGIKEKLCYIINDVEITKLLGEKDVQ